MTWPRAEKLAVLKSGVGPWLLGVVIQDIMVVNRKKPAAVAKKTVKKSLKSSGSSDSAAGPCATRAIRDLMAKVEDAAATWRRRLSPHKDSAPAVIKVAADCAGCGSDLTALRLLGLAESCKVVMFSESDPNKIVLHEAAARCCGVSIQGAKKYSDIFDRCDADAPTCDLFTAGFVVIPGKPPRAVGQAQACVPKGSPLHCHSPPTGPDSGAGVLHSAAQVPEILEVHFEDSQVAPVPSGVWHLEHTRFRHSTVEAAALRHSHRP